MLALVVTHPLSAEPVLVAAPFEVHSDDVVKRWPALPAKEGPGQL